ncbi:MAG: MBL fold metallo-hydrolase [Ignavibacteria bacterium]|jgi:ribonuclease BN (tRNA processing enzyme)
MELQFVGCGSAFTTKEYYQSNLLVKKNGKNFLIDIGGDARFGLAELGLSAKDIDAFTLTHAHADHCGGVEWLAFSRYFAPGNKPTLYGVGSLLHDIWTKSLAGGLESVEGKMLKLEDYFPLHLVSPNETFEWEGIEFRPIQTVHVMNGFKIVESYGYMIQDQGERVFFTGDTQFAPNQLTKFYDMADVIFHDSETAPFKSGVHAHYSDLKNLPANIKSKMWLYHYQPGDKPDAVTDGFNGFVVKGQSFPY